MSARTYRFSPIDRTGVVLGLSASQAMALGAGVAVAIALRSAGLALVVVAVPVVLGAVAALVRVGDVPLLEAGPPALAFALRALGRRNRWFAPLPPIGGEPGASPVLPPALAGQVVLAVDVDGFGAEVAVVHDRRAGRVAATVSVAASGFALAEAVEQDRRVAAWGEAQGACCTDASPVVAIRWSEWCAPADVAHQLAWLAEHGGDPDDDEVAAYRDFVTDEMRAAARHEVLVTVVVDLGRVRAPAGVARLRAGVEAACAELRSLTERLGGSGLVASEPFSPSELARALRLRLDPTATLSLDASGRSLGQLAGLGRLAGAGPLATDASWGAWRVDDSWHRGFLVTDWPRVAVWADWMAELLRAGGVVRSVAVVAEPVPARTSRRAVERQAAKLSSDAEHRSRSGLRIGAAHDRAEAEVAEREAELVAGHGEVRYAGVIVVSAPSLAALDEAGRTMVSRAAAAGIELRALHGRHDQALGACLPLARTLAPAVGS